MRITKYNVELNIEKLPILVKETAFNYEIPNITNPQFAVKLMNDLFNLSNKTEEYVFMIALNTKGKVLGVFEISHGIINASLVQPREILMRSLLINASSIIIMHNHPSGDTTPSSDDKHIKERIKNAGTIIGIDLLDFIILGNDYYSFKLNEIL